MNKLVEIDLRPYIVSLSKILEQEGGLYPSPTPSNTSRIMIEDIFKYTIGEVSGQRSHDQCATLDEYLDTHYTNTLSVLEDEGDNSRLNYLIDEVYDEVRVLIRRRTYYEVSIRRDYLVALPKAKPKPKTIAEFKRYLERRNRHDTELFDPRSADAIRLLEEFEGTYTR